MAGRLDVSNDRQHVGSELRRRLRLAGHAHALNGAGGIGAHLAAFRGLAAARVTLVRSEIASRPCSATAARMWMVSLLACGLSTATNSTPEVLLRSLVATE